MDRGDHVWSLDIGSSHQGILGVDKKERMIYLDSFLKMFLPQSPRRTAAGIVFSIGILSVFVVIPDMSPEALWLVLLMGWAWIFRWPFRVFAVMGLMVAVVATLIALITPQGGQQVLILALGLVAGGWIALLGERMHLRA